MEAPEVIAKSSDWLVVNKPAGWLSVPGRNSTARTLSEWAREEHGPIWVVHRLDRETSGVILFARTAEKHREAGLWFQKHQVRKAYDLLAVGSPRAPTLKIQGPVDGSPSTTQLECKERFAKSFLGRAVPLTGRRHQIRVHLAGQGHALLGDPTYKGPTQVELQDGVGLEVARVALHAARLELPTREVFEAPWPEDFRGWVESLRAGAAKGASV